MGLVLAAVYAELALLAYVSPGSPVGFVNDFAQVLSPATKTGLEQELSSFATSTSNEIAIVIIRTVGDDETIESYAVKLFEEWKIGKQDIDNGILFLVAVEDRVARIEVGYGLEGALPDAVAARILRNEVLPRFKQNDFEGGIRAGVSSIEDAVRGEYAGTPDEANGAGTLFGSALFFLYILGVFFVRIFSTTKSWWLGGVIGAGAGAVLGVVLSWTLIGTALSVALLGSVGLLIDYLLSRRGPFGPFQGPSSGPWTFGGKPSSPGTSFGGFGGGSSGGGGASGRW